MQQDNPYEAPNSDASVVESSVPCPTCGRPYEKGHIQSFGNVTWYPEMTSFKRSVPMRLSPKGFNLESKINGLKCGNCKTITVQFPEE